MYFNVYVTLRFSSELLKIIHYINLSIFVGIIVGYQGREVISEKYSLSVFNKQPSNNRKTTQSKFLGQHFVYLD